MSLIHRLRVVAMLEGVSFLVLLGIAMPLKYLAGQPMAVRVTGMAHGLLFILYVVTLARAVTAMQWPFRRAALLFAAAFVPCGPFLLDGWLRDQQRLAAEPGPAAAIADVVLD